MAVLHVTFGTDHEHEDKRSWVRADGYATFEAPTIEYVYKLIDAVLGREYAFTYGKRPDSDDQGRRWYPEGETAHIIMHFSTAHESGWTRGE